jgi:hypothetical protein
MAVAVFTGSPFTNSTTGRHALEKPRRGVVRVLDSGLARMLTGDISSTPTTVGLGIVLMGRMRMIDAVGVTGAFQVRYLASVKVCDPTPANGVHPRGVLVGSTFGLVHFLDDLLRRSTGMDVPYTSTTSCVDRVAGSGARLRVGRRAIHVASATTAERVNSRVMSIIDGRNELAIISATTLLGSSKGCLAISVLATNGIARG